MSKPVITLTESARERIVNSVRSRGGNTKGVHLSINGKGCSGFSYVMDFCDGPDPTDPLAEKVTITDDICLYVDSTSLVYLLGLEIDWEREMLKEGFVFKNPNAKGSCGCGESFHV